ncbi:MAG: hypothetical protein ACI835_003398 [Planctomycetota bacterium]|jgi:hypothetical protein
MKLSLLLSLALCSLASAQSEKVYWAAGDSIFRSDLSGANLETVLSGLAEPSGVAVERCDGHLYWTDLTSRQVMRSELDGSSVQAIFTSQSPWTPTNITVDPIRRHLYLTEGVTSNDLGRIARIDYAGSNHVELVSLGFDRPVDIKLDLGVGRMYWSEFEGLRIQSANLDGTQVVTVAQLSGSAAALALDLIGRKVYWADAGEFGPTLIQRANLDGSNLETLPITFNDNPSLSIDEVGQKLYFTDQTSSSDLQRSNLDGSNVQTLVTTSGFTTGMDILFDDAGVSFCPATANSTGSPTKLCTGGTSSLAANELVLVAQPAPNQPGLFFYGPGQTQLPFGNGFLCVTGPIQRQGVTQAQDNVFSWHLDTTNPPTAAGLITAGSQWSFQLWFRDPAAGGAAYNLSDARTVQFLP